MRKCKGLGVSIDFNNKACHPVPTIRIHVYAKQEPCGTLFTRKWRLVYVLQPTDRNIVRILVILDDVLSGIWSEFDVVGLLLEGLACMSIRDCTCIYGHIRHYYH